MRVLSARALPGATFGEGVVIEQADHTLASPAMAAPGGAPGGPAPEAIELSPKDITLRVSVEARFSAQTR